VVLLSCCCVSVIVLLAVVSCCVVVVVVVGGCCCVYRVSFLPSLMVVFVLLNTECIERESPGIGEVTSESKSSNIRKHL